MMTTWFTAGPPLRELHELYAKKGRLDERAPIRSTSSITINAPVAVAWRLVSDLGSWHTWRSDARVVDFGALEPDARFRWKVRGMAITSTFATFAVVAPERELSWTGVAMGCMRAIDRMRMTPVDGDRTVVAIEESLSAPLLTLFYDGARLRKGHEAILRMLKATAETGRAGGRPERGETPARTGKA